MDDRLYKELYELELEHWWFCGKKEIIIDLIKKYKKSGNLSIFDAGCGSGLMLKSLKEFGEVCGMDASKDAIKYSKLIFNGNIKPGSLPYNIPFEKESFDLILLLDVLEHIDKDVETIRELKKFLKKDGIIIITVPAFKFLWSKHDVIHHHKKRYSLKEIRNILNEQFAILKISYYNFLLFLPIALLRIFGKIFKSTTDSDAKMPNNFVNNILKKIFAFEKYLLRYFNLPFGVSIISVCKKI